MAENVGGRGLIWATFGSRPCDDNGNIGDTNEVTLRTTDATVTSISQSQRKMAQPRSNNAACGINGNDSIT